MKSLAVVSNQDGINASLEKVVRRHLEHPLNGPIHRPTLDAFENIRSRLVSGQFILDSCCGVGLSTYRLAAQYPDFLVVGVDQSEVRLSKTFQFTSEFDFLPKNVLFLRAECGDLWRLLLLHKLIPFKHFLLYPNPWPKNSHLKRRWHGHGAFDYLVKLSKNFELRSNWKIYVEEFQLAAQMAGIQAPIEQIYVEKALTLFEQKYHLSGHEIYRLSWNLGEDV